MELQRKVDYSIPELTGQVVRLQHGDSLQRALDTLSVGQSIVHLSTFRYAARAWHRC